MRKVLYVLGQLDDQDADWMARAGSRRSLHDGETIIRQGEHTAHLYILLAGHLAVDIAGAGRVARLQTGEVVGEMSFVDSSPSSATVLADGQAIVLALPKSDLEGKIAQDSGFGLRFYRALALFLADRLRTAQQTKAGVVALSSDATQEDELDDLLLDTVSLGGDRFDRMMRRLAGMR
jgi:CRP-like cAMP-binding protein